MLVSKHTFFSWWTILRHINQGAQHERWRTTESETVGDFARIEVLWTPLLAFFPHTGIPASIQERNHSKPVAPIIDHVRHSRFSCFHPVVIDIICMVYIYATCTIGFCNWRQTKRQKWPTWYSSHRLSTWSSHVEWYDKENAIQVYCIFRVRKFVDLNGTAKREEN